MIWTPISFSNYQTWRMAMSARTFFLETKEKVTGFLADAMEKVEATVAKVSGKFVPEVDVWETEDKVLIVVDVPGCSEVDVTVKEQVLILRGSKKNEELGETLKELSESEGVPDLSIAERSAGDFERQIPIVFEIDPDKVKATCKNGVLIVRIDKRNADEEKPISIHVEE